MARFCINFNLKVLTLIVGLAVTILLSSIIITGCATNRINLANTDHIDVIKNSSSSAKITKLAVYSNDSGISVSGELRKRIPSRGRLYGYVDVGVLSPDGTVLFTTYANYHLKRRKSYSSKFTIDIPLVLERGSAVRVTHHRAPLRWCKTIIINIHSINRS